MYLNPRSDVWIQSQGGSTCMKSVAASNYTLVNTTDCSTILKYICVRPSKLVLPFTLIARSCLPIVKKYERLQKWQKLHKVLCFLALSDYFHKNLHKVKKLQKDHTILFLANSFKNPNGKPVLLNNLGVYENVIN